MLEVDLEALGEGASGRRAVGIVLLRAGRQHDLIGGELTQRVFDRQNGVGVAYRGLGIDVLAVLQDR